MATLLPETLKRPIGELHDNIVDHLESWRPRFLQHWQKGNGGFWPSLFEPNGGPAVEVSDDADAVHVTAELPGLNKSDFSIELEGDRLIIKGEKKSEKEEKKEGYYYSERSYGSFYRAIPLPCEVNADKIAADYKKGVLKVTLPKTDAAKAKKITINVA